MKYTFLIILKLLGSVWYHIQPVLCCCSVSRNGRSVALHPSSAGFLRVVHEGPSLLGTRVTNVLDVVVCLFVFLLTTSFLEKSKLSGKQSFFLGPNIIKKLEVCG